MWIEFALKIAAKINCFHVSWHLELMDGAELPGVRVPLTRQQMQITLVFIDCWLEHCKLLWLIQMHIEFFVIEETHILSDLIVVHQLAKVVLWRPQTEVLKIDLLIWIISKSVVEH